MSLYFVPALSSPTLITLFLGAAVLYLLSCLAWRTRSRGLPLPPGPPRLPFIGNMFNIPKFKQWHGFRQLGAIYGDILYFRVLGDSIVVLQDAKSIIQYLDKSSANTSDRKQNVLIDLVGANVSFGFMPYGSWWRRHRRALWQHFRPQAVVNYHAIQKTMAAKFLGKLLKDPSRFEAHMRYTFSASLMDLLYDIQVADEDDEYIAKAERVVEGVSEGLVPGRYLVEVVPALRYVPSWFPGAGFQKRFAAWREASNDLWDTPVARVKEAMASSSERQEGERCVIRDLLSKVARAGVGGPALAEEEMIVKDVGAVAFEAGSDTMFSTLQTIFLALSINPELLKNAHAELDAVVGPTRLPDYSDQDSLVYVNAIIREASRWIPVLPLGVPHCTIEDDEINGYFIPKGTVLMPNVWACMHDPEVYPNPAAFRPERFIRNGKFDVSNIRDPFQFTFGFGRRICPGRYFAESALFINVASVLHVFDIGPPLDEGGVPIHIVPAISDGLIAHPEDSRCTITPRSPQAERLIMMSKSAASR